MNIDVNSNVAAKTVSATTSSQNQSNGSSSFADELSNLKKAEKVEEKTEEKVEGDSVDDAIDGLEGAVAEINDKLNQTDETSDSDLKSDEGLTDKNIRNEGNALINNDMNVQELKDALAFQMNASMNFNSENQQFSQLMNEQKNASLKASASEIAEEKAILSSMEENVAIANRNKALAEVKVKTVSNNEGIKKVDTNSNVVVETVIKFDEVVMSKADVDFFANLVENGQVEMTHETAKSAHVSKTLADLLAKSMKDNQPIRIDFDNNISVIIKIGKDGKISADFLPSSQVAEAYLKENLPLLRQRFDDNNIEYDSLNQRRQKQEEKDNQKKGQKDE